MKKFFKINYLIILTLLTSCVDEIDMSHFDHQDRIVINSLFTTDSIFTVQISKTIAIDKYIYYENHQFDSSGISIDWYNDLVKVNNPTVELWQNNILIEKLTPKGRGVFCSVNEPQTNQKYQIKVSASGFESVSANDIIPEKVKILSGNFNFLDFSPDEITHYTKVTITFKDPGNKKNYYEVNTLNSSYSFYDKYGNVTSIIRSDGPNNLYSEDPVAIAEGETSSIYRRYFFSDNLINGKTYDFTFYITHNFDDHPDHVGDVVLPIELKSISYNYYLYLKKLREYKKSHNNYNLEDFYKTGDPIIMFTNVENGYGVFAGFSSDTITLTDKDQIR